MKYVNTLYTRLRCLLLESDLPKLDSFSDPMDYIKRLWLIYNEQYFDNKLDPPNFRWKKDTQNLRALASFSFKIYRGEMMGDTRTLSFSKKLLRNETLLQDTLIHEMCHQAVAEIDNDFHDKHGPGWKRWARSCGISASATTDVEIPKTHSEEEREIQANKRNDEYQQARNELMSDREPLTGIQKGDVVAFAYSENGKPTLDIGIAVAVPKTGRYITIATTEGSSIYSIKIDKSRIYSVTPEEVAKADRKYPPKLVDLLIQYFSEKKGSLKRLVLLNQIKAAISTIY